MSRWQTVAAGETWSVWFFLPAGRTVSVAVFDEAGASVTLSSSTTVEDTSGVYRFDSSQFSVAPTTLKHYVLVATDAITSAKDAVQITIGGYVNDIDAATSSRSSHSASDVTTDMDANSTNLDTIIADIAALNDLSSADVQTAMTAQGYTAARAILIDNLDALVSSRSSHTAANVRTEMDANSVDLDQIQADIAALNDPTAVAIADQVWDELRAGHVGVGSFGEFIDAAISSRSSHSASDVTTDMDANSVDLNAIIAAIAALNDLSQADVQTALDSQGYTTVRAALLDNLDATISSRASAANLATVDGIVDLIRDAIVCTEFVVAVSSSTTEVRSDATQADDYWNDLTLVVIDGSDCSSRQITDYANTNGAFTVAALPFTPSASARAIVVGRVASAAGGGGGPTADTIAAAVWDKVRASHTTAGTFGEALDDQISLVRSDIAALNDLDQTAVQAALTAQGYTTGRALLLDNLDAAITSLNDLAIADIQTAMTAQGYTAVRAGLLDNLDLAITAIQTDIAALNDLSSADVQTAMTAQGYTVARGLLLSNLDATISSVLTAIAALNDIGTADVQTAMTSQGYTVARAALLDNLSDLTTILATVEKVRKVTTNRVVVNVTDTQVDVYEDNGTTIAFSFQVSADRRERTVI